MKNTLALLAVVLFAMVGVIGCGDNNTDPDDGVEVNVNLKFETGDKFTYNYYERDEQNARDESTKRKVEWTVVGTDMTKDGRSDAVEIREDRYDETGATIEETNMIYLASNGQGQVFQHNVLKLILQRFSGDGLDLEPVISQLSDAWSQISDVKSPSALSWTSLAQILQTLNDVDLAGVTTLDVKVDMSGDAMHEGRVTRTVAAGTFDHAYVTNHTFPVTLTAAEDKDLAPITTIKNGDPLIQATGDAAMEVHYIVDVDGGILSMTMDSKQAALIPQPLTGTPYPVNGFEMELTAVERVAAQ